MKDKSTFINFEWKIIIGNVLTRGISHDKFLVCSSGFYICMCMCRTYISAFLIFSLLFYILFYHITIIIVVWETEYSNRLKYLQNVWMCCLNVTQCCMFMPKCWLFYWWNWKYSKYILLKFISVNPIKNILLNKSYWYAENNSRKSIYKAF